MPVDADVTSSRSARWSEPAHQRAADPDRASSTCSYGRGQSNGHRWQIRVAGRLRGAPRGRPAAGAPVGRHAMGRYVLRRLLQLIPVFFGTTFLIYVLVWAVPGDPFAGKCGERPCPDAVRRADDREVQPRRQRLSSSTSSTWGTCSPATSARRSRRPEVGELIAAAYPITLKLALVALAIEAVIGIIAGVAHRPARQRLPRQPGAGLDAVPDRDAGLRHRLRAPDRARRPAGDHHADRLRRGDLVAS